MKYLLIALIFIPSILQAEWKFKENVYFIPKTEVQAIKYSTLMDGTVDETERYKKLSRKIVSPTLENFTEVSKCVKETMTETNSNGITATYERIVGYVPDDYNYSVVEEREKKVLAEMKKLKALEETDIRTQAESIVDSKTEITK